MKQIKYSVEAKLKAYHALNQHGAHEAAKVLNISVDELMKRVRGALYFQAKIINIFIKE